MTSGLRFVEWRGGGRRHLAGDQFLLRDELYSFTFGRTANIANIGGRAIEAQVQRARPAVAHCQASLSTPWVASSTGRAAPHEGTAARVGRRAPRNNIINGLLLGGVCYSLCVFIAPMCASLHNLLSMQAAAADLQSAHAHL